MSPRDFRLAALKLPGAAENSHPSHPDFRVGKRVFATLGYPDENRGMVKLTPEQQSVLVGDGVFRPQLVRQYMSSDAQPDSTTRAIMRWVLAAFFTAAGIAHLRAPGELLAITPSWVPFAPQVILVTGLCEIAGSVALVTRPLRRWAGIALAVYAICVWPANFKHAIDHIDLPHISNSWLYHGPRLAFQPVIVWWALYCSGVIDWPWRRKE